MDTYPKIKIKASPQLSFDIQVEIMKRLPVRSLIQFRSVCKAWKSMIDSPKFIAGYYVRHDQQHLLVRYEVGDGDGDEDEDEDEESVSLVDDDTFPHQKFSIPVSCLVQALNTIGSSHGLLCFKCFLPDFSVIATLWNPAIRKSISVVVPYARLGTPNYIVAFGVRPDTVDPTLVKITYLRNPEKMESISCIPNQVMVFTLSSGEWTCLRSDHLPRKSIQFTYSDQTVIGRFIYLLAYEWIPLGDQISFYYLIISFDLITNEFREVRLPNSLANEHGSNLSISSLRGESLVVIEYDRMIEPGTHNHMKRVCTVWMMEHGDSKALTKLFTINAPNLSVSKFAGCRKNGEAIVIAEEDYEDYPCALVVFEPCSEHVKELGFRGHLSSLSASFYTESLLLLDQDDGHIVKCVDL